MEVLLVQFLVLAFTGALWWLARRDLASHAAPSQAQTETQDLELLCATLEALVTDLARRLESLERQTAQRHPAEGEFPLPSFAEAGALLAAPSGNAAPTAPLPPHAIVPTKENTNPPADSRMLPAEWHEERVAVLKDQGTAPSPTRDASAAEPRQAALDALLAEGITDPSEIARRTGLGRGEVDLILSLRARRAL